MRCMFFILLFTFNSYSQHLGVSIDGTGLFYDGTRRISPSGFSFIAGVEFIDDWVVEARTSYSEIPLEYNGWDFSGHLIYKFKHPFYVTANYIQHSNHGIVEVGTHTKSVGLIGLGAGIEIAAYLLFEISYSLPIEKPTWVTRDRSVSVLRVNLLKFIFKL